MLLRSINGIFNQNLFTEKDLWCNDQKIQERAEKWNVILLHYNILWSCYREAKLPAPHFPWGQDYFGLGRHQNLIKNPIFYKLMLAEQNFNVDLHIESQIPSLIIKG